MQPVLAPDAFWTRSIWRYPTGSATAFVPYDHQGITLYTTARWAFVSSEM
jgi:hypothetical protein